ncbi:hypothetical protein Sphch_3308 [Sphingobium chlorophenolicum L-1]|uniref:SnoaL-like domain-containing protein n=1 Tax=Sphingobium chlorophenolicum L-1 TaxID=690566 RepID=F6F395_SPHCR|nr:nuclear transport factor 2 family protein [Sphingobium chlorophenolicum]AEG50907.1 hypothetical protein Sphch_3308 [Sphingobium chlorophenolicum L-1]
MLEELDLLRNRVACLEDRIAVQDRIWAALICSDLGDWAGAAACYTQDATVDLINYDPSIWPDPIGMPLAEFRRLASTFMPGFSVRQHMVSNFDILVQGEEATSRSQVRAIHVIDGQVWEAHATYCHRLRRETNGWKICHLQGSIIHQMNKELIELARRKVAANEG